MLAMKKVRVAWTAAMSVMISSYMAGMELFKDSFKGPSIKCSIVGQYE